MEMRAISKGEFEAYEKVRSSGRTNMFDVRAVESLSGGRIGRDVIIEIMQNYAALCEKYPGVRKGN
jgi:hypothetical protein